jgi:conjugative transfer signal peptidase TraF
MDSINSVVRQDKCSGSPGPAGSGFSFPLRLHFEGHLSLMSTLVTHADESAVTRAIFLFGVLLIGAVSVAFLGRQLKLRIMLTDSSAAAGVYRITDSPPMRGALVAACLPPGIARQGLARGYLQWGDCPVGAEPIAKVIGALPGDVVELDTGWVSVNGVKFLNSQMAARDSAGRPLAHVSLGARRVGTGEVWLFGFNNARSWDARYFGAVPSANLRGVLKQVVAW